MTTIRLAELAIARIGYIFGSGHVSILTEIPSIVSLNTNEDQQEMWCNVN